MSTTVSEQLNYVDSLKVTGMEEQVSYYDQWQIGYDKEVLEMGYGGPKEVTRLLTKYVKDKNAKIIDVVAGSGILGAEIKKAGYENIEGLDGSQKMLDIAKSRNIYKKYHCQILHPNEPADLPKHFFDVAVASGCFAPGHLETGHFQIFTNLVKPGGKIVLAINAKFFKESPKFPHNLNWDHDLTKKMTEMEQQGVWKILESETKEGYFEGLEGRYFVIEVL